MSDVTFLCKFETGETEDYLHVGMARALNTKTPGLFNLVKLMCKHCKAHLA